MRFFSQCPGPECEANVCSPIPFAQVSTMVTIDEVLDIRSTHNELICFVGAGGKTTTLFKLARELKHPEKKVLVTTTTAIFYPDESDYDEIIVDRLKDSRMFNTVKEGCIIVFAREVSPENKLMGIDREFIEELYKKKLFHYILVEGDGSKRKPIKAPAFHEPVIPNSTRKTIGVIGLDSLGKKIDSNHVHRPELFCKVTGSKTGDTINEKVVAQLIGSPEGLFKGVPKGCQKYLLLNKADNEQNKKAALKIIEIVKKDNSRIRGFIVATMADERINAIKWWGR